VTTYVQPLSRFWHADRDCMECGHHKIAYMPEFTQHWPDCPALRRFRQEQQVPTAQPAAPDGRATEAPEEPVVEPVEAHKVLADTAEPDLLNLQTQVRDGLTVRHPDRVFVISPADMTNLATLTITRRQVGEGPDVTQRPLKLSTAQELLPEEWLQAGDHLMVARDGGR
jgi:hypothetical protein